MNAGNGLSVAIVGCGKIADQHVQAIGRIAGCRLVAVCDREPLMAGQLAGRFGIPGVYSDVGRMLDEAKPTVVHVTTPPQSHLSLALQCIEAGCHVYLEKPFAVNAEETATILRAAEASGAFRNGWPQLPVHPGNDSRAHPRAERLPRRTASAP